MDGSGHLQHFTQYTYNERGKRSTEARYSENNILSYEVKYDDHGNEIKTSYYDDDGALSSYSQSEYDEDGTKIKNSSYRADGTLFLGYRVCRGPRLQSQLLYCRRPIEFLYRI